MKNKKIVIHLAGNSCTGKSTIARALSKEVENLYTISYDKLKWQLTNYNRDEHKPLIKKLARGFFNVVCNEGLPILLDAFIVDEKEYNCYLEIAKKNNYKFVSFKLTTHKNILIKRFRERVKSAKKQKIRISITDENLFLENSLKEFYTPKNTLILDTSKSSLRKTTNKIIKVINKK